MPIRNLIEFYFDWVSVWKSRSHTKACIAVEYVSMLRLMWWGAFRLSRKDLLSIYLPNKHLFVFGKKRIAAQLSLAFFDTASKIFCRFNCSSLANRSMDSSLGRKKDRWGKICWGLFNPSQFKIKTERCLMMMNLFHPLKHILTVAVWAQLFVLWSDSCNTFLTVCQI